MTKSELKQRLDYEFEDDEVVVCADNNGSWDNIVALDRIDGTPAIFFGGGSPFASDYK